VSSNPIGHVSRGFCAKTAATSMEAGARWPVVASPEKKNSGFFAIIFGFFRIFILPSVNLCRVLFWHSAKSLPSVRQKTLGKICLPTKIRRVSFVECRHSANPLPRVF